MGGSVLHISLFSGPHCRGSLFGGGLAGASTLPLRFRALGFLTGVGLTTCLQALISTMILERQEKLNVYRAPEFKPRKGLSKALCRQVAVAVKVNTLPGEPAAVLDRFASLALFLLWYNRYSVLFLQIRLYLNHLLMFTFGCVSLVSAWFYSLVGA